MIMAPAGTPKDVVARFNAEVRSFAAEPAVQQQMARMGILPVVSPSPAELERFLAEDIERWSKLVHRAGIAGSQ